MIKKNIEMKTSDFFYQRLLEKYKTGDTGMTSTQQQHLYFGAVFQNTSNDNAVLKYEDSLRSILSKDSHSNQDILMILKFTDSILSIFPFAIGSLNYQLYCYTNLQDQRSFETNVSKLNMILNAVMSTGNGSKEFPYHVIDNTHQYAIIGILGYDITGKETVQKGKRFIELADNHDKLEGLYFMVHEE